MFFFMLGYFLFKYGKSVLFCNALMTIGIVLFIAIFTIYRNNASEVKPLLIGFVMALAASIAIVGIMKKW